MDEFKTSLTHNKSFKLYEMFSFTKPLSSSTIETERVWVS